MPQLLAIDTAAERLAIGRTLTKELIAAGELETVRVGRRRLVVDDSVDAYIGRLRAEQNDTAA